ncbi:hypothetical protein SFRURICE_008625 [Spodoptera frugiperda]|nr:hypothetical protein SFRURICE_008625 [Spodoptera frugiperda]
MADNCGGSERGQKQETGFGLIPTPRCSLETHITASTDPHRTDRSSAMPTCDVIGNDDAKNLSESGICDPIANNRVGNPNAEYSGRSLKN